MIISKTPYRISFFGGGTDYEKWFRENGGQVLSTTISHYCYLTYRLLPPFFNHTSRVVWRIIEEVQSNDDIQHPVVNAVLKLLNIKTGVDILHDGDLPARSGLGTSSTFTVGLLNAVYNLNGFKPSKKQLAEEAIYIERIYLKESGGIQDQIAAAYGGFNHIQFKQEGDFEVSAFDINSEKLKVLESHLMLFYTGISRNSFEIAEQKSKSLKDKSFELNEMGKMVDEAINIINGKSNNVDDFGRLLHESWLLKKTLASGVSTDLIDSLYSRAMENGALGGKILGAGGGGFLLFFVEPENQPKLLNALSDLLYIPFHFENTGSDIIFDNTKDYLHAPLLRKKYLHLQNNQQNDAIYNLINNLG